MATILDIGCGSTKKAGSIGIDYKPFPGVDHVLNLEQDRLPFPDDHFDEVYSSHFFEHIESPLHILGEILRVAKHGAKVEIWTPYSKNNHQYLPGHVVGYNESVWEHVALAHPDYWQGNAPAVMRWERFHYVVSKRVIEHLGDMALWFAIQYLNNVVMEIGAFFTVAKGEEYRDKTAFKQSVKDPGFYVGHSRYDVEGLNAPQRFWKFDG